MRATVVDAMLQATTLIQGARTEPSQQPETTRSSIGRGAGSATWFDEAETPSRNYPKGIPFVAGRPVWIVDAAESEYGLVVQWSSAVDRAHLQGRLNFLGEQSPTAALSSSFRETTAKLTSALKANLADPVKRTEILGEIRAAAEQYAAEQGGVMRAREGDARAGQLLREFVADTDSETAKIKSEVLRWSEGEGWIVTVESGGAPGFEMIDYVELRRGNEVRAFIRMGGVAFLITDLSSNS